jgi:hypothetical protein
LPWDQAADGRQRNLAGPLQQQQQTAADYVAQGAVGLFPPQGFAQLARQLPTATVGMRRDELPQKSELLSVDGLPAVAPRFRHNRSMPEKKSERKLFL